LAMLAFTNCMNFASWPALDGDRRKWAWVETRTKAWMAMPDRPWALLMSCYSVDSAIAGQRGTVGAAGAGLRPVAVTASRAIPDRVALVAARCCHAATLDENAGAHAVLTVCTIPLCVTAGLAHAFARAGLVRCGTISVAGAGHRRTAQPILRTIDVVVAAAVYWCWLAPAEFGAQLVCVPCARIA